MYTYAYTYTYTTILLPAPARGLRAAPRRGGQAPAGGGVWILK